MEIIQTIIEVFIILLFPILIIGLINPKIFIKWDENPTRKQIFICWVISFSILFALYASFLNPNWYDLVLSAWLILWLFFSILFIIGLIKPNIVLFWKNKPDRRDVFIFWLATCSVVITITIFINSTAWYSKLETKEKLKNAEKYFKNEQYKKVIDILSDRRFHTFDDDVWYTNEDKAVSDSTIEKAQDLFKKSEKLIAQKKFDSANYFLSKKDYEKAIKKLEEIDFTNILYLEAQNRIQNIKKLKK